MKILLKVLKIFLLFTVISVLFLFSPFTLFFQKSTEVESSIDESTVYATLENESNTGESLGSSVRDEVCDDCAEKITPEIASVAQKEETKNDESVQPDCSLEQPTINKDFQVYEKNGMVYVEIFGEITAKKGTAAYDFVRKQGCLTSSPNLVFLNE